MVGLALERGGQADLSGGQDLLNWLLVDEVVKLIRERDRVLRQNSRLVLERRLLLRLLLIQILCEDWACERLLKTQARELLQRVLLSDTVSLDREIDHGASNLHCFVVARQEGRSLLDQNEGPELALVVLEHELSVLKLDFGVTARHRDIVDAQVAFVAATELENFLGGSGPYNVNNSGSVLFLVKGLKNHIVARLLLVLNELKFGRTSLDHQRVGLATNFALEALPVETTEILRVFGLPLHVEPRLQTLQVDTADRTVAATAADQRVVRRSVGHPAEAALVLSVFVVTVSVHYDLFDLFKFLKELVIGLIVDTVGRVTPLTLILRVDVHPVWGVCVPDLLDGELDPADLQNVLLLDLVVLSDTI